MDLLALLDLTFINSRVSLCQLSISPKVKDSQNADFNIIVNVLQAVYWVKVTQTSASLSVRVTTLDPEPSFSSL